jgi:hypothetical protein
LATPEKDALPLDGLARLEQLHRKTKDEAEAWQKLLENMDKLKAKQADRTETPKPVQRKTR